MMPPLRWILPTFALLTATAAVGTAQDELPLVPEAAIEPVPEVGPAFAPPPAAFFRAPLPTQFPVLPQGALRPGVVEVSQESPVPLYPNVRYKDLDNIAPFAVKTIVAVRNPQPVCGPCGAEAPPFVFVEICVPPGWAYKLDVKRKDHSKVGYDFGDYEVEITSKDGLVTVDYDD